MENVQVERLDHLGIISGVILFCFFNILILDFPQRIFFLGVPYVDSLS